MTRFFILDSDLELNFMNEYHNNVFIKYKYNKFSGGEPHLTILNTNAYNDTSHIVFLTKIKSGDDLIKLAAAISAFENLGTGSKFCLFLPYFPGARQDRICNAGEAFTAKVYADIINNLTDWDNIQVLDPHSDVTAAILNNSTSLTNHKFVNDALTSIDLKEGVIVSPDAGSNKKIYELLKSFDESFNFSLVRADKSRDLKTGNILETIVYADNIQDTDCVIIDDICDGGRTFIELAKVLKSKGAKTVTLIVTHGIFSNGFDELLKYVDQIVTTNSFTDSYIEDDDRITVISLNTSYFTFN